MVLLVAALALVVLGVRLAQLELLGAAGYRAEARNNLKQPALLVETRRGSIMDRSGLVLAKDAPRFDLCLYYPALALEDEAFVERLEREQRASGFRLQASGATKETASPSSAGGFNNNGDIRAEFRKLWANNEAARRKMAAELHQEPDELGREMSAFWPELARATGLALADLDRRRAEILRTVAHRAERIRSLQGEVTIREETAGRHGLAHPIIEDLDERGKAAAEVLQSRHPLLLIQEHAKRSYPYGDCAAHVVGYVGEVREEEVDKNPDGGAGEADDRRVYHLGDLIGRDGIESSMEGELRGTRGMEQGDRLGRILQREEARAGQDVVLTLSVPFQAEVEAALGSPVNDYKGGIPVRGAAVVIDLRDGGMLAMASTPRYNPATFYKDYETLSSSTAGSPLLHRAVAGQLPPGSIFKLVTATAALDLGKIEPGTTFNCPGLLHYKGHDYHCWRSGGHGELNLHQALAGSCDVYFYNVGLRLGDATLMEWARRFGFASKVGIDLPGEKAGEMEAEGLPWFFAIGQGHLTATPLQAARMCALVATGGRLAHEVHLVQRVGEVPRAPGPVDLHIGTGHLAAVRSGMLGVVNEPGATGYETVHSTVVTIAGKSGSAQNNTAAAVTHSWFIGYAPAENPQIAVAVMYEHGGGGAKVAGCTVKRIIETAARQGIIGR